MHITAICPTYGRFELLRAAVGCFVTQTHADRDMLILNDAPVPIECDVPGVRVINNTHDFGSLGGKYAHMLDEAEGDVIAHWEDDDLYLPWHLASAAEAMDEPRLATKGDTIPNRVPFPGVVKPRLSWCVVWDGERWKLGGRTNALCEASTVYHFAAWTYCGGYRPEHSTHSRATLLQADSMGMLRRYDPRPCTGYVFCRLHPGIRHGSGLLDRRDGKAIFEAGNKDFGDGQPLTPVFDDGRLAAFRDGLSAKLPPEQERRVASQLA